MTTDNEPTVNLFASRAVQMVLRGAVIEDEQTGRQQAEREQAQENRRQDLVDMAQLQGRDLSMGALFAQESHSMDVDDRYQENQLRRQLAMDPESPEAHARERVARARLRATLAISAQNEADPQLAKDRAIRTRARAVLAAVRR